MGDKKDKKSAEKGIVADNPTLLSELAEKTAVAKTRCALQQRRILKGHFGKIYAAHWAQDSKRLVSASQDGKLIVWNAFTTNKEHAIGLRSSWVMTCAYCPNAEMVAAGGLDNIVSIYKLASDKRSMSNDKPAAELAQHEGYLSCCRFIDNTMIISSSGDSTCILWDIARNSPKQVFTDHSSDVMSISICPANPNIYVSGSCDALSKVWDTRQAGKKSALTFGGHDSDINSVCFIPDGSCFATGSDDSSCSLLDLRAAMPINRFASPKVLPGVTSVSFSASGRLLFASYDESVVHVWDSLLGSKIHQLDGHEERVSCVAVSPDGQAVCTASWDTTMKIWA
jgi:guanine nucleotide-binding protein G(I)/G(S)/G(T) subunit beta-1